MNLFDRIKFSLLFLIFIAGFTAGLCAAEKEPIGDPTPAWVLPGILMIETRSHYSADGSFIYGDRRDGSHGEIGPFQVTARAFTQVANRGEEAARMRNDPLFALRIAKRYLFWLRARTRSWAMAVAAYHVGLRGMSSSRDLGLNYAAAVKRAGGGR